MKLKTYYTELSNGNKGTITIFHDQDFEELIEERTFLTCSVTGVSVRSSAIVKYELEKQKRSN